VSGKRRTHVYSRMARALNAGTWVVGLVTTLGGMFDPTPGPNKAEIFPGVVFVAAEAVLIVRSLRLGLVIDDALVTSRGILRTRRFQRDSVTKVRPTGYSGTINWGATSGYFMMLKLRVAKKPIELPHLIGPPNALRRLSDEAQAALDLPKDHPGDMTR